MENERSTTITQTTDMKLTLMVNSKVNADAAADVDDEDLVLEAEEVHEEVGEVGHMT